METTGIYKDYGIDVETAETLEMLGFNFEQMGGNVHNWRSPASGAEFILSNEIGEAVTDLDSKVRLSYFDNDGNWNPGDDIFFNNVAEFSEWIESNLEFWVNDNWDMLKCSVCA